MSKTASRNEKSPSLMIDERIRELGDWRGKMLSQLRVLIKQADPEVVEEWKWRGVPVWYHDGMICTGETYKNVVKMTFAKGAALDDPSRLSSDNQDGCRIASPEMLPEADPLPHVICSRAARLGSGDGAEQYGNTR
jgi:hypothetical protein